MQNGTNVSHQDCADGQLLQARAVVKYKQKRQQKYGSCVRTWKCCVWLLVCKVPRITVDRTAEAKVDIQIFSNKN